MVRPIHPATLAALLNDREAAGLCDDRPSLTAPAARKSGIDFHGIAIVAVYLITGVYAASLWIAP